MSDVSEQDKWLIQSVEKGDPKVISELLGQGANPETLNKFGLPLLMLAIERKKEDIVDLFIKYHANVNVADNFGRTPLMYAAKYGEERILQTLLKAGAQPDEADQWGATALNYLIECSFGFTDWATLVIEALEKKRREIWSVLSHIGGHKMFPDDVIILIGEYVIFNNIETSKLKKNYNAMCCHPTQAQSWNSSMLNREKKR